LNVHWESVLEGATAGIAASVILGLGALSRNYVRDFWFRLRLKREFRLVSCNWNLEGVTASLHNHLGQAFTVRHFALITERGDFLFNPLEEVRSSFKGEHPKPTRKQLRALKKGEIKEIPLSVEFQYRRWRSNPSREGFATIEPFTSQEFLLPLQLLADKEGTPSGFRITVEYEAWPRKRRIWKIVTPGSLTQNQKTLINVRQQLASGYINSERAKLGKAPIRLKMNPTEPLGV
jgi:hypothetical protein